MINETYVLSLISGLLGVIIGIIAQYFMQNQLQKERLIYDSKEKVIYEIQNFTGYLTHLEEICCDDEEEINKFTKDKNLLFSQTNLLYQYFASFLSSYYTYNTHTKNKLDFHKKIQETQNDLLLAVDHCLFCPEKEARLNIRKIVKKYRELFERIMFSITR